VEIWRQSWKLKIIEKIWGKSWKCGQYLGQIVEMQDYPCVFVQTQSHMTRSLIQSQSPIYQISHRTPVSYIKSIIQPQSLVYKVSYNPSLLYQVYHTTPVPCIQGLIQPSPLYTRSLIQPQSLLYQVRLIGADVVGKALGCALGCALWWKFWREKLL
jgi:hypothetical protein